MGRCRETALIIGWLVCGPLRWVGGGVAAAPREDTQNECLHQKKLRLATSAHVWAIFQMSISGPPEESIVLLLSQAIGKEMDRGYFFYFFSPFFFFRWHAKIGWVRVHAVMFKERRWIRAGREMLYFPKKLGQPVFFFFLFALSRRLSVKPRASSPLY